MRMSMLLISFFTVVIDFLMFCRGFESLKLLPVSSIFPVVFSSLSLMVLSSYSNSSVVLFSVVKAV
jgi:hypothetical protein